MQPRTSLVKRDPGNAPPGNIMQQVPGSIPGGSFKNMINSVQMDFSVLLRCNGNEIGLFGILDQLILSGRSDSVGEDEHRQQCLVVYHHREVNSRILVVGE